MIRTALKRTISSKVNYYEVLNIPRQANSAEVKKAYRELVKKHHPDIAKSSSSQERFRLITEAYSVLYNLESRTTYDLTKGSKDEIQAILAKKKDKDSLQTEGTNYQPHEWGYKRLKELADQRKKFNLDKFYRFKGGVPQKDMQYVKKGSWGQTGERVNTEILNNFYQDTTVGPVDSKLQVPDNEAQNFKLYKSLDSHITTKRKPLIPAEIDYTLGQFRVVRNYVTFYSIIGLVLGSIYMYEEFRKAQNRFRLAKLVDVLERSSKVEIVGLRALGFKS